MRSEFPANAGAWYDSACPPLFKGVYGFDVAVDEEAGCLAWRGNEKLDEDTSVFGTILIVDQPAAP